MGTPGKIRKSRAWLHRKYVVEGLSLNQIAEILGCTRKAVSQKMKKLGIPVRPRGQRPGSKLSDAHRQAISQGRLASPLVKIRSPKHKPPPILKGPKHPRWKGGQYAKYGRVYVLARDHPHAHKNGYVARARLVMEEKIGRLLKPEEVVHHINGDKMDDRPENLMLFPNNPSHSRYHTLLRNGNLA